MKWLVFGGWRVPPHLSYCQVKRSEYIYIYNERQAPDQIQTPGKDNSPLKKGQLIDTNVIMNHVTFLHQDAGH